MSRLTSWACASDRKAKARARRRGAEGLMGFILNRRADGAIPSVVSHPAEVITPSPGGGRRGLVRPAGMGIAHGPTKWLNSGEGVMIQSRLGKRAGPVQRSHPSGPPAK